MKYCKTSRQRHEGEDEEGQRWGQIIAILGEKKASKEEICLNLSALSFFFLLSSFPLSLHASAVSLCLSLSVHQPFLTIKNLSSHFPSNSPALSRSLHFCYSLLYHRSLSINLTGSLACLYLGLIFFSLHFVCQRLKQKEPHVFFVFYFLLRHQNRIQRIHKYIFARKKKKSIHTLTEKKRCSAVVVICGVAQIVVGR